MKIDNRIERGLAELEERIKTEDISKAAQNTREWAGADVIISRTIREDLKRWAERDRHVISCEPHHPNCRYGWSIHWLTYGFPKHYAPNRRMAW